MTTVKDYISSLLKGQLDIFLFLFYIQSFIAGQLRNLFIMDIYTVIPKEAKILKYQTVHLHEAALRLTGISLALQVHWVCIYLLDYLQNQRL